MTIVLPAATFISSREGFYLLQCLYELPENHALRIPERLSRSAVYNME
jgi:hypothetical protein